MTDLENTVGDGEERPLGDRRDGPPSRIRSGRAIVSPITENNAVLLAAGPCQANGVSLLAGGRQARYA